ncbi:phytoene/squalene synthase family protein [Maritalea sp.]|uniref:phytoene/squalene synthase family protein n=1 Tax=Maritalea sp. TaxID=2003361 RepID=UPI003EF4DD79
MVDPTQQHVADELNKLAREDYLTTLFLPEHIRADAQALLAFSAELNMVRQRVSEPTPGEIRLQWWHDALDGKGHGAVRANPVADGLLNAIQSHNLPIVPLKRMIAAHRFDLYDDPMTDVNQFEGYAGETRATIYQFMAMMLAPDDTDPTLFADAAGHLGVAKCYIDRLFSFGRDAAKGQIYLPISVFSSFGLSDKQVLAGQTSDEMTQAARAHLEAATTHLQQAELAIEPLPKDVRPAFASSSVVNLQVKHLKSRLSQPFASSNGYSDWRKLVAMMFYSIRN